MSSEPTQPGEDSADDEDDEEFKDVYAHFGVAMYYAQCLEHQLVMLFVALRAADKRPLTVQEIDEIYEQRFAQTMGTLIKDLSKIANFGSDLSDRLKEALRLRNRLAHDYFREQAEAWFSKEGRMLMLTELTAARDEFMKLADEVTAICFVHFKERGYTREMAETIFMEEMSRLTGRGP